MLASTPLCCLVTPLKYFFFSHYIYIFNYNKIKYNFFKSSVKWKFHLLAESSIKYCGEERNASVVFRDASLHTHVIHKLCTVVVYCTQPQAWILPLWGFFSLQDWVKSGTFYLLLSLRIFTLRALIPDCMHNSSICLSRILCTLFLLFSTFSILKVQIRLCCCRATLTHAELFTPFDFKYFPAYLCLNQCFFNMLQNLYFPQLESCSKFSKHFNCNLAQFSLQRAELKHKCEIKTILFKMEPFLIVMHVMIKCSNVFFRLFLGQIFSEIVLSVIIIPVVPELRLNLEMSVLTDEVCESIRLPTSVELLLQ